MLTRLLLCNRADVRVTRLKPVSDGFVGYCPGFSNRDVETAIRSREITSTDYALRLEGCHFDLQLFCSTRIVDGLQTLEIVRGRNRITLNLSVICVFDETV